MFPGKLRGGFLLIVLVVVALGACGSPPPRGTLPVTVSFIIPINDQRLGEAATVRVQLWNARQVAIKDQMGGCRAVRDRLVWRAAEACPAAARQPADRPETFTFPVTKIEDEIRITSRDIKVGERYQLRLTGLSADGCPTALTTITGVAGAEPILLDGLSWARPVWRCD